MALGNRTRSTLGARRGARGSGAGWAPAGLVLALAASAAVGDGGAVADAEDALGRLQAWLTATRDLEGAFEQALVSGALGTSEVESGRFYVLRPGAMRWDYLEPERKVAIVRARETRLYVEQDAQLWEGTLEGSQSLLPSLLTEQVPLAEVFEARVVEAPGPGRADFRLELTPRAEGESFASAVVTLRPPAFSIRELELVDAAGNRIVYRFARLRRNRGLDDTVFRFEPPAGTEIVRAR